MGFAIPLHISRELRLEDRLDSQKRAAAQLAFLMNGLNPKGFRTPRKNDANDMSFVERRLFVAGMLKIKERRKPNPIVDQEDPETVADRKLSLTNYEQTQWYRQRSRYVERTRRSFIGCRSAA